MSILTIVQNAHKRLGLASPSTVYGNTETLVIQFLALLEEAGKEIRDRWQWPQCNKEASITLVSAQAGYELPDDFSYRINSTDWDRTNQWPTIGLISAPEWQRWKSGITTTPSRKLARIKGPITNKYTLHPTPDSGDAGDTLVYEFQSRNWLRPATAWAASTAYTTADYRYTSYGHIYKCASNGTSSTTEPTHTDGTAADGSTSWTYVVYEDVLADTDVSLLNETLMTKELLWRWRAANRLDYTREYNEAMNAWRAEYAGLRGTPDVRLGGSGPGYLLSTDSVPESGFGGV